MKKFSRITAALAATTAFAFIASGCSNAATGDNAGGDKLNVVATTTQIQDWAKEVGGDHINLTGLLKPGASAHHFDPSAQDLKALGEADVLIVNGAGLEGFVDSAVEASGFDGEIIDTATGVKLADGKTAAEAFEADGAAEHDHAHEGEDAHAHEGHDHAEDGHDHAHEGEDAHAHEGHDHADEGDAGHDHAHEGEDGHDHGHDHDHGGVNPHLWTSVANAEGMVQAIADGLAKEDQANKADYEKNAGTYIEKLHELETWVQESMDQVPAAERKYVASHNALEYFLDEYDITYVGSVMPSFEDNAEPSSSEIDAIVAKIKAENVKAVFVESSVNPKLTDTIAKEAGVKVVTDPIYADSLAKDGEASTYIGSIIANTNTLVSAWGASPKDVPSSLQ